MLTVGGGHARLSCRQGTDLRIDMVRELVPFFMFWKHSYGSGGQHRAITMVVLGGTQFVNFVKW